MESELSFLISLLLPHRSAGDVVGPLLPHRCERDGGMDELRDRLELRHQLVDGRLRDVVKQLLDV